MSEKCDPMYNPGQVETHIRFEDDDASKANVLTRAMPLETVRGNNE